MLCELNRTIELVVNLNVICLDFVFVLISFVHLHGIIWREVGVRLKLDVQNQGGGSNLDVDGGGRSLRLDNFHGRQMCIIP